MDNGIISGILLYNTICMYFYIVFPIVRITMT
jgi:hypothetical protein